MDVAHAPLPDELNVISGHAVDCALKVHRALGPGLLETVYEACLARELRKLGHKVETQVPVDVEYDGEVLEMGFRIDLLVDGKLIIEVKSVGKMHPLFTAQLLTYLRLSKRRLGLLINFNVPFIREGIERVVN